MPAIAQVPEIADGGYWCVVKAVPSADAPGWTFGPVEGCAWYAEIDGVMLAAVRTVEPNTELPAVANATVAEIIASGRKPYGRVRGR